MATNFKMDKFLHFADAFHCQQFFEPGIKIQRQKQNDCQRNKRKQGVLLAFHYREIIKSVQATHQNKSPEKNAGLPFSPAKCHGHIITHHSRAKSVQ